MADEDGTPVVTYGPRRGQCVLCGRDGPLKCGRCQTDFYCGRQHQIEDWPRHRKGCGSIALHVSSEFGRYVVATKDIPAGAILMREIPLVATPPYGPTADRPVCVGCFVEPSVVRQCSKCGWPVCGEMCSNREIHQPECAAFQRAKYRLPKAELQPWNYELWYCLGALRVTLACEDKTRGSMLLDLQSDHSPLRHCLEGEEQMQKSALLMFHYKTFKKNCDSAVSWIRDVAGLQWLTAEAVRRGAGILFINSCAYGASGRTAMGVFAGTSLLAHSCRPNTDLYVWKPEDDPAPGEGRMECVLVASRDIARGEPLGFAYQDNYLLGSMKRRMAILAWNFLCECELCSDPSQLGLHLEAWCCSVCSVKKTKAFPVTIQDIGNRWSCSGCGESGSVKSTLGACAQVKSLETRLESLQSTSKFLQVALRDWERFINDALWPRGPLHPTHSLVLQAKEQIVELDSVKVLVATFTPAESQRVATYCRDLLAVSDVVCPGINAFRQHLLLVLAGLVEGQMVPLLSESMRTLRFPQVLEDLLEELEKIHTELLRVAVSPKPKKTTLKNLEELAKLRKSIAFTKKL